VPRYGLEYPLREQLGPAPASQCYIFRELVGFELDYLLPFEECSSVGESRGRDISGLGQSPEHVKPPLAYQQ